MTYLTLGILAVDLLLTLFIILGWAYFGPIQRRVLVSLLVLVLPLVGMIPSNMEIVENMKTVKFCLSCHEMQPYGDSLKSDDDEIVAGVHWNNNTIPQETACYHCHTGYTYFGGVKGKAAGLQHMWKHYTNQVPKKLKIYEPFNVDTCLHCHGPSKKFEKVGAHSREEGRLEAIKSGRMGCLTSGCHDVPHLYKDKEEEETVKENSGDKHE